ncbi:MAG: hypothetical protein IKU37_04435 [Candidatus Gastranaerophilales bacterium]|nr:hypothetical protein [Candidatus Gastranaerophilales bacterium]
MDTLVKNLLENQTKEKIQKPNCQTRSGRALLAFYLQTKFKQIINHDKKSDKQVIIDYKSDFIENFTNRLIDRPNDRILIALSGESASGKSTICKQIARCIEELNLPVSILTADNYFNDISELIKIHGNFDLLRDSGYDVDSPKNFYLDLLREDILKLQKGFDVLTPEYLVNGTGVSKPESILVKSKKIIIVEGMCSVYKEIQDVFDIKIYIDLDEQERKRRFLNRAISRNQDSENAFKHWNYIKTAGSKYLQPRKKDCEIIINGECDLEYFAHMVEYINLITNNFTE